MEPYRQKAYFGKVIHVLSLKLKSWENWHYFYYQTNIHESFLQSFTLNKSKICIKTGQVIPVLGAQRLMGPKVVYFLSERFFSLLRPTIFCAANVWSS